MTPHFSARELTRSGAASRLGICNQPNDRQLASLKLLAENVLEPVRRHFGAPVFVSSGYRSEELNMAIGGSNRSQHCYGQAADLYVFQVSNLEVCRFIAATQRFDQLIAEYATAFDPYSGWVHVSYTGSRDRRQVLTKSAEGYAQGLPE